MAAKFARLPLKSQKIFSCMMTAYTFVSQRSKSDTTMGKHWGYTLHTSFT